MKQTILLAAVACSCFISSARSQGFYDRSTVQKIEIFFGFSNWDAQLDALATTTEDYLLADSVRINGIVFDSVGVKYKGNSSYNQNNNKNPMHIELDYVHGSYDYQGYTDIKLQNGYQDPSMIREVLSYAILEQYMDCPKANFANVYINGTLRGVYSNAESINSKFNGDHYYTSDGSFFKCNPIGGAGPGAGVSPDLKYLGADSSLYATGYELKSDEGWNNLVDLTNTLNNNFSAIESKLDMDRALWMLAYNNVLVNLDSYSGAFRQNYYLYKDLNQRFVPTVWDLNMSFAGFPGGPTQGQSYTATTLDPFSNSTSANHPLIQKIMANQMYKRMYMAHLRTIVQEIFASGDYLTTANTIRTTIDASVQADPYKFYTYTQFQNGMTTSVTGGGGPGGGTSIPGIQQLMSARVSFFQSNSDYLLSAPSITAYAASNNTPNYGETVTITATCSNETTVFLGYRLEHPLRFNRVQMFDDGMHNDGAAGDHVYGADVTLNGIVMEYYIYAENSNAGLFSPARAEHEYHSLNITIVLPATGDILINELMADNGSTAYDSNGENDDWVELYNSTSTAKDLSGLYLSDDISNLMKWQIPLGTAVNANDVLIIWTDNDSEQSGLHANFKLSSAGESLILSDGTSIYDQVDFGQQTSDISYARCPDGGTFTLTWPTFDILNNCSLGLNELLLSSVTVYPNPTNDFFTIQSDVSGTYSISDLSGRLIDAGILETGTTLFNAQNWQAGNYLVRILDKDANAKTIRLIRY
ncbi:MAG: CotH kinase family protein [Fluviicola sp.]